MNNNKNNNNISRNNNGTSQACAACKYQRRKCGPTCILAPYFPHDRQKQFLNAHKLFGVGKISNMIKNVQPEMRDATMSTIIYQSDMRALDPVGGCYRHILNLQSQIEYYNAELQFTLQQLAICRQQQAVSNDINHFDNGIIIDDNNNDAHANVNVNDCLNNVNYQHQHLFDDQQMNINMSAQSQMQPQFDINTNYVPLQDDFNSWMTSIPPLSPVMDEEDEEEDQPVVADGSDFRE